MLRIAPGARRLRRWYLSRPVAEMTVDSLKAWCEGKLSGYKIPKKLVITESCPAMRWGRSRNRR